MIFVMYGTTLTSPFQEQITAINYLMNHQREDLKPWIDALEDVIPYEFENRQLFRSTKRLSAKEAESKNSFIQTIVLKDL